MGVAGLSSCNPSDNESLSAASGVLPLPPELEPWRPQFEKSVRPFVRISTELSRSATAYDSKFGGYPYLPPGEAYPMFEGEPMILLAQINWAGVPSLPDYPQSGILQIFIPKESESYGFDYDDKPGERSLWELRWYPEPGQTQTDLLFLPDDKELHGDPVQTPFDFPMGALSIESRGLCYRLAFDAASGPVLSRDGMFKPIISTPIRAWHFWHHVTGGDQVAGHKLWEAYDALYPPIGAKIGGYTGFSQDDTRPIPDQVPNERGPDFDNPWKLLLQIELERGSGMMWGDMGVANFFIRREDLLRRDFSRVWYTWDCS